MITEEPTHQDHPSDAVSGRGGSGTHGAMNASDESHPEPAVVASFAHRGEAEVVAAKLLGAGLDAVIVDDSEGGAIPLDGDGGVVVAVPAHEAEDARIVLSDALPEA
jgi:hypothetical protein